MQNAVKHAGASSITVDLSSDGDQVRLVVRDDGSGFEPAEGSPGHGLGNMRDRIDAVRGRFALESDPGHGATVLATVPIQVEVAIVTRPPVRLAWVLAVASLTFVVADTAIVAGSIGLLSARALGIHGWPLVNIAAGGCAVLGAVDRRRRSTSADRLAAQRHRLHHQRVHGRRVVRRWVLFEGGPGPTRLAELSRLGRGALGAPSPWPGSR